MSNLDFAFRDPYPSDPGIVFDEHEIRWYGAGLYFESAERRAELETQMPTYRPAPHPLHNVRPGA